MLQSVCESQLQCRDKEGDRLKKEEILQVLSERIRVLTDRAVPDWERLQEIRIRSGKPVILVVQGQKIIPNQNGQVVSRREFRETLEYISNYSLYAFEEEIRKGYLTIPGGHRVGVAGKAVLDRGEVKTLRNISFLNIRVSHEVRGCADRILPYLFQQEKFLSTLIVSAPGGGKTTLLRDLVRQLGTGGRMFEGKNVSVVDERSEIAGCYMGIPQRDVGTCTDVLDACPKYEGMVMMIRSMAPEVLAVDEIGTERDYEAMQYAVTSGCALLATIHGDSVEDLWEKPLLKKMISEQMFSRIVLLRKARVQGIFDSRGKLVGQ